jgi:FtsP/CotA-like multicopper oxidase with cupredoxin domain
MIAGWKSKYTQENTMNARKLLNVLVSLMVLTTLLFGNSTPATAMPMDPTDETKVPHYFGPNPNWANSPFTLPDAQVVISGNGTGATAEATVGANGAITSIMVTNGGRGYNNAQIDIIGSGTGARARATIVRRGSVVEVRVDTPGTGYTAPTVSFSGGGPGGGAAATAYGGVEQVTLTNPGSGYTMPTVDFDMPNDPDGVQAKAHVEWDEASGVITAVVVDSPGSGYSSAPGVTIRNGTIFAPLPLNEGGHLASATSTLSIQSIVLDSFGADYNQTPSVTISDPTGTGATATAFTDDGVITAITVENPGSGYLIPGLRKFVDTLPGLGAGAANNLGQYIPVAVRDTTTYPGADYYVIELGEYEEQMHSDLPPTRLRGYRQANMGGTPFNYLGPAIVAQKDRPVRILFRNTLPADAGGDLFIPTDSTIMGSGMGPMAMMEPMDEGSVMDMVRNPDCSEYPKPDGCFADNRATLHLHGGNSPWISDGTPHQWITPANETTPWPEGVSVVDVPDMATPGPGEMTFFYTNQQSARLMFYHDHSWGITRLNVYAGEAAPYIIKDDTELALVNSGTIPGDEATIPLVIQDRTFVPQDTQLYDQYDPETGELLSYGQDPTWDKSRWGDYGDLWYHHVYMPAQNPGAPGGMSAFGRWMYSPWFWPPQDAKYDPIPNPYYDPSCNMDDPATWQYQEDPFCEPPLIPGTPLISAGMEQFNDTPIVNGTAYPTVTLEPKAYRLRMLNAANDRFFNFQWYVADPTTASTGLNALGQPIGGTEVALNAAEVAAAQLDPVVFPTPDLNLSPAGPDWVVIASEGGFLPKPVVVDGQQVTTWIEDPTRFDAGLVDQHSLLLAPAERADVVVDFSRFAGKTLILYNDAPAAFPARIPSYDYYTGAPDLRPVGAPQILPGYGPNTRTVMQVKIAGTAAPAFNLSRLQSAFSHRADGSGVFESGQHPIIVGQAAYNSAYGTNFAGSGWCNAPSNPSSRCDGFARISEQGGDMFKFDTLSGNQVSVKIEPKAIQDETSESNFDEYGRMSAVLGVEVVPATPGFANTVLYGYAFPVVDMFDTSDLPTADMQVTPISSGDDGTQIWKITHNGVDTHPIHFHAYDVQVLNRVTWDNIIKPPHPTELGWKDTVRVSPLEDTYFAMRPVLPVLPFDFPNSVRLLSPMMPEGAWLANSTQAELLGLPIIGFAPNGEPIDIPNHYVNFGAEFVYHCHILSHEEMDMMHAVSLTLRPVKPDGLALDGSTLSWTDQSLSETAFAVQKSSDGGASWIEVGRIERAITDQNTRGEGLRAGWKVTSSAWSPRTLSATPGTTPTRT